MAFVLCFPTISNLCAVDIQTYKRHQIHEFMSTYSSRFSYKTTVNILLKGVCHVGPWPESRCEEGIWMTRPRILISATLTRHFPASISTSDVFVLGPFSLSTGTLLELCVLCCELILAVTLQNNRKQNRIIFGSFCSGGEESDEHFFFFPPLCCAWRWKEKHR